MASRCVLLQTQVSYAYDADGLDLHYRLFQRRLLAFRRNGRGFRACFLISHRTAVFTFIPKTFDKQTWFGKHVGPKSNPEDPTINELVESVINALKAEGVTRFGTTGYCFGGEYDF